MADAERSPRERMVLSAAALVRRDGVTGTGLRDVVEHARAPRGSLQHYFPDGKQQLIGEALRWAGGFAAERVHRYLRRGGGTPAGLFAYMAKQWTDEFSRIGFAPGCPLVAAAADTAATSDVLRGDMQAAFDDWRRAVAEGLESMGVPGPRSGTLATVMISALEGAIVFARIKHDTAPIDAVVAELAPVLDGAVAG